MIFILFFTFRGEIKTQVHVSLHTLENDNASKQGNNDIVTCTSYIDSPSQNRVAEVKSGHFPETAKVLLFESHVPKCIRVDAISTTYFLQGNSLYLLCFFPNYYYLLDMH